MRICLVLIGLICVAGGCLPGQRTSFVFAVDPKLGGVVSAEIIVDPDASYCVIQAINAIAAVDATFAKEFAACGSQPDPEACRTALLATRTDFGPHIAAIVDACRKGESGGGKQLGSADRTAFKDKMMKLADEYKVRMRGGS
jgi:hypothetical protein